MPNYVISNRSGSDPEKRITGIGSSIMQVSQGNLPSIDVIIKAVANSVCLLIGSINFLLIRSVYTFKYIYMYLGAETPDVALSVVACQFDHQFNWIY